MTKYLPDINGKEVIQNNIYAGILKKSLKYGPELATQLHNHQDVVFSENSKIAVIQNKLGRKDDRELDWVITGPQVIGFESKKKRNLEVSQLTDEIDDLRKRSDSPILIVITDDLRPPKQILKETREQLRDQETLIWQSWHQIAHRIYELASSPEALPPEQRPLVEILQDMFESEDYERQFNGIETPNISEEELVQREKDLLSLISDITAGLSADERWEEPDPATYSSDTMSNLQRNFYQIWPSRISFRFLSEISPDSTRVSMKTSAISLLTHLCRDEFLVVLDICADVDTGSKKVNHEAVTTNAAELVQICSDHDLQAWTSNNSWNHSNSPMTEHDLDDLHQLLSNPEKFGFSPHKRVLLGRQLQSTDYLPQEFVIEVIESLELLKQVFLDQSDIFNEVFPDPR